MIDCYRRVYPRLPSPRVLRLLLVRHGQSEWNAEGRWQGRADPPLSPLGRLQARHAAGALGAMAAVYSSTLERAASTAELLAAELGIGPVIAIPGLIERDAGAWSGLTRDEIDREFPGYLNENRRPPGWEDDESLLARASDALIRLVDAHRLDDDADVLVVTHGGLIYAIEDTLGGGRARMGNLDGRWLEVDPDLALKGGGAHFERGWRLGDRLRLLDHDELTIPDQL